MTVEESLDKMCEQRDLIFASAKSNIARAQKHYTRNYNERNVGTNFYVGDKVLKKNPKTIGRKEKMLPYWVGPYTVIKVLKSGNYLLKDRHSKEMKRPIPPQQLKLYQADSIDNQGNVTYVTSHLL